MRYIKFILLLFFVVGTSFHAKPSSPYTNRLTIGYNLEVGDYEPLCIGNGVAVSYVHTFGIAFDKRLCIDLGTKLTYSLTNGLHYTFDGDIRHHYTNWAMRVPVNLGWRFTSTKITLLPYLGIHAGIILHHTPNSHDGKINLALPCGFQTGVGAIYKRCYFGVDASLSNCASSKFNFSASIGWTF